MSASAKEVIKSLNDKLAENGFAEQAVLEKNSHDYDEYGRNIGENKLVIYHKADVQIRVEIKNFDFFTQVLVRTDGELHYVDRAVRSAIILCQKNGQRLYKDIGVYDFENDEELYLRKIYEGVALFLRGRGGSLKTKWTLEELHEEALKDPNPYLLKDIEYPDDYPIFKFCPNPLRTQSVIEDLTPCECCGKSKKYSYIAGIDHYTEEEVDEVNNLCLDCIANDEAIKKFGGAFTDKSFIANRTKDKAITEEIMYRTPSFQTWQDKEWLSHCKTPCAYIGKVYIGDLLKMGIYKQVRTELAKTFYYKNMPMTVAEIDNMLIDMTEGSSLEGHLFKCIICGRYKLHTDLD